MKLQIGAAIVGLSAVACASYPKPIDRLANAEAAVRAAREVGAPATPKGALHLKYAEEEIAKAKKMMNDDDNKHAASVLACAEADAELAVAFAKEASVQAQVSQATQQSETLQQHLR